MGHCLAGINLSGDCCRCRAGGMTDSGSDSSEFDLDASTDEERWGGGDVDELYDDLLGSEVEDMEGVEGMGGMGGGMGF